MKCLRQCPGGSCSASGSGEGHPVHPPLDGGSGQGVPCLSTPGQGLRAGGAVSVHSWTGAQGRGALSIHPWTGAQGRGPHVRPPQDKGQSPPTHCLGASGHCCWTWGQAELGALAPGRARVPGGGECVHISPAASLSHQLWETSRLSWQLFTYK